MEACLPPRAFSTGVGTQLFLVRAQVMLGDPPTRVSGYCGPCTAFSLHPHRRMKGVGPHSLTVRPREKEEETLANGQRLLC